MLAAVLALALAGAWFLAPAASEPAAVEAIPSGAFLVATIDLAAVRASPLAKDLGGVREVGEVAELCGFDPLAHAKSVAIGVPEKPDGVFGLAITSDLAEDDLVRCAKRVMSARSAMPSVTRRGGWTLVEQEGLLSAATRPKIAYRDGAPLLVARGDYLATMQGAVDGETKRAADASAHAALRKRALPNAFFVATALLPKSVRDRIQQEMGGDATPAGKKTMAGILAVSAVSLSVAPRGDAMLDVAAELDCDSDEACATVRDFLDQKRKSIAAEPGARFAGIAGLLDAVHLDAKGPSVALSLTAPEGEIVRAARAVLGASGFSPGR